MSLISDADLPMTIDGRIYHLNLKPEELADTIITVGDPARVARVSRYFDKIDTQVSYREFVTHTGTLNNKRLSVISTGIGTSNIDIVLNEIDALKNIDFQTKKIRHDVEPLTIIRFGTTGGLQKELGIGDIVCTTGAFGLDNLLSYYQYDSNARQQLMSQALKTQCTLASEAYFFDASPILSSAFSSMGINGLTTTCPGFYGPQDRTLRLAPKIDSLLNQLRNFNFEDEKILNFEMETAAILGLSQLMGHHATSISVIVANRSTGHFTKTPEALVDSMIEKGLEVIQSR